MKELYEKLYEQGFSLIPIKKGTKLPAISWAPFQSSRANKGQVSRWFSDGSNTIGIVTGSISDLVVVDCDDEDSADWAIDNLSTTFTVKTKSGVHLYYSHPGGDISNRAKIKHSKIPHGLKIDIRGDGGYVLGVGAIHPSGDQYLPIWTDRKPPREDIRSEMAPFPCWLTEREDDCPPPPPEVKVAPPAKKVDGKPPRPSNFDRAVSLLRSFDGVTEGGRNNKANEIAFAVIQGLGVEPSEELFAEFQRWNQKNSPPLPNSELKTVWKSAAKANPANRGFLVDVPRRIDLEPSRSRSVKKSVGIKSEEVEEFVPSQRDELEMDVAVSCSVDASKAILLQRLEECDFKNRNAAAVFLAIRKALSDGLVPSITTVGLKIEALAGSEMFRTYRNHFQSKGLSSLSIDEIENNINALQLIAAKDRLMGFLQQASVEASDPAKSVLELQESLPSGLAKALAFAEKTEPVHEWSASELAFKEKEQMEYQTMTNAEAVVFQTGLQSLDRALFPGIQRQQYVLIVGYSGQGKTVLGDQLAAALARYGPVLSLSFEMSTTEKINRAAQRVLRKDGASLKASDHLIFQEKHLLSPSNQNAIRYEDKIDPLCDLIIQSIELFLIQNPKAVGFLIDQLSLVSHKKESIKGAIDYLSGRIKRLCIKRNVVGLALIQENNEPWERFKGGKMPTPIPKDIRDTQKPFHDCDKCLHIWNPRRFRATEPEDLIEIHVTKNRQGKSGTVVRLKSELWCCTFSDRDRVKVGPAQLELEGLSQEEIDVIGG